MILRERPDEAILRQFIQKEGQADFSYPEIGMSRTDDFISGYDNDLNRIRLGQGEEVYRAACEAIRNWQMFPGGWASIAPGVPPIREGETVAMIVRLYGFYWVNSCRIVYTFEEDAEVKKFGFAYGTLPNHIEKGEERFSVEMLPDGSVWYDLRAYSRPRFWLVKLGYPVARFFQRRFVKDSQRAMQRAVWEDARKRAEREAIEAEKEILV
jgi:uncharacterized protein (UPF0548 family)